MKNNNKWLFLILQYLVAFGGTCSIPYILHFENPLTYSNSIVTIAVFVSFLFLLKKTWKKENKSKIKNTYFLGFVFSTFLVFGNSIKTNGTIEYLNPKTYLAIFFISFIISSILVELYRFIEHFEEKQEKEITSFQLSTSKKQLLTFLIIAICWILVFLAVYPGYFCYDAYSQFLEYLTDSITDWHPAIHTLLLGKIITVIALATSSFNLGIAIYTILQMLIILACFMYCLSFLQKYQTSRIIRSFSLFYYALFPVVVMFAMCSTKDALFSAFLIVSIIVSLEALINKEKFLVSPKEQLKFILITFLAIIFRKNALYAYIPFLLLFSIAFHNLKIIKPMLVLFALYFIYSLCLYSVFQIDSPKNSEALSVPLQQIARVYNYHHEDLTEEELDTIYQYTSDEQLRHYLPECSDLIKSSVYLEDMGYGKFFSLWLQIGLRNPRNLSRFFLREHFRILVSRYHLRRIY